MKVCKKCQVEYSDDKNFCRSCGSPLEPKGTAGEGMTPPVVAGSGRKAKGVEIPKIVTVLLIGLAFAAVILVFFKISSRPKTAVPESNTAGYNSDISASDQGSGASRENRASENSSGSKYNYMQVPSPAAGGDGTAELSAADSPPASVADRPARLPLPKAPWIQRNVCPFEGCQYGTWTARENMFVYENQDIQSKIAGQIQKGEQVQALRGDMVFVRLGKVVVNTSFDQFMEGDSIVVLSYQGEGDYSVWNNGKIETVAIFWRDDSRGSGWTVRGTMVTTPISAWWVNVKLASGKTGWVDNSESLFSGSDRFD